MLAPAVFEDNSLSYTTSGLTATNCTINAGGYCKIGNLVIVNVRLTPSAESGVTVTGFPAMDNKASAGVIDYISTIGGSANLAESTMSTTGAVYIYRVSGGTMTNNAIRFMFVYLSNS